MPTSQEMYPSLSKFWDLIITELNYWRSGTYMFTQWGWDSDDDALQLRFPPLRANMWSDEMADRKCPTAEEALTMATLELIRKGYHVETLAVNPQTISAWKRYLSDY